MPLLRPAELEIVYCSQSMFEQLLLREGLPGAGQGCKVAFTSQVLVGIDGLTEWSAEVAATGSRSSMTATFTCYAGLAQFD